MNIRTALHILNLDSQATPSDVKRAYRRLAAQWHPDLHTNCPTNIPNAAKKMQEINNAYTFALDRIGSLPTETAKKKTSLHTVRCNARLWIFLLTAISSFTLAGLVLFLYNSHSTLPSNASSSNQTNPTVTSKHHRIFQADNFHHLDHEILQQAQRNLVTIGYPTGKIDGIFGPQSLAAVHSFHTDFSFLCTIETAEDMLRSLAEHALVAASHPEWRSIVQSEDFHSWFTKTESGTDTQPRHFSTAPHLTHLLDLYTFTTALHTVQPLPLTELLWQKAHYSNTQSVTIVGQKTTRQHSFIKLVAADSNQELLYGFIRQGDQLTIPLPKKRCLLKLATGKQWYGKRFLFGPATQHGSIMIDQNNEPLPTTFHLSSLATSKGVTIKNSVYNF